MNRIKIFSNMASFKSGKSIEELVNEWFAENPNVEVVSTNFSMNSSGCSLSAVLVVVYKEPKSNNYVKENKDV